MKILHYTLGLPPYRSGGLTKYSIDLMISQIKLGNNVDLLYPGRFNITNNTKVKSNRNYKGIRVHEIINPLPVSLLGGIRNPKKFMDKIDGNVYLEFLNRIKPDIIHIHTLMGIHKEFIEAANMLNIKTIYTTHDYFGICPKVNLIDFNGKVCSDYDNGKKCITCNKYSYSMNLIYIMQSKLYRELKCSNVLIKLRNYKNNKLNNIKNNKTNKSNKIINIYNYKEYTQLRKYYIEILSSIDYFHFNSSVAKKQYEKYIPSIKGKVIHITHSDIKINNLQKLFSMQSEELRISYLGPINEHKGFYLLKDSLDELLRRNITNWKLNIYGDTKTLNIDSKYYMLHGRYSYSDLENIFNNTDILVIPSICKETFGFIGLEALSYGVPVIISKYVGLKDIVEKYKVGITFNPNLNELSKLLQDIINNKLILNDINKTIIDQNFEFSVNTHSKNIIDLYNTII